MASGDFESLWAEAGRRYAETSGEKLTDLPMLRTSEDLIKSVEEQNSRYRHFREKQVLALISLCVSLPLNC